MGRLVLYTYEQPRAELMKCGKCGYEASSLMMVQGMCPTCGTHAKSHEKISFEKRTLQSSVTRKAVEMRCYSWIGSVPEEVRKLLVGRYIITEGELPVWIRWNARGKVRQLRYPKGGTGRSA